MIFLSTFIEPEKGNKQRGKDIIPEPLKEKIVATDLSGWTYLPRKGTVAVDSVLGRIAFPTQHAPKNGVWVSYCYGFSADIGGGEYDRACSIQVNPITPTSNEETAGEDSITDAEAVRAHCQGIGPDYRLDPIRMCISDSIVDATHPDKEAIGAPECPVDGTELLPVDPDLRRGDQTWRGRRIGNGGLPRSLPTTT